MSKLPYGVVNELKCADCRSPLSHAPIKILPDGRGICGRCPSSIGIHSSTFEKLAGIFVYPCKYRHRGCIRVLTFREVTFHEAECSYRPSCCFCCKHPCNPCGSKPNDKDINGDKPIIADDRILSTLRCVRCSNYLSSSPILIGPDGSDVCLACAQNENPALTRNIPLETILNAFVFQCRYIKYGCEHLFSFGAISVHESNCEYHYQRMLLEDRWKDNINRNVSRKESMRSDRRMDNWMKINKPLMEELNAKNLIRHNDVVQEQPRMSYMEEPRMSQREQPRMSQREQYEMSQQRGRLEQMKEEEPQFEKNNAKSGDKSKGKIRGVVETPRGHIYATITPNTIVAFKPTGKKGEKHEMEPDSGRSTPINNSDKRSERESVTYNRPYNNLVEEFKVKQKHHTVASC